MLYSDKYRRDTGGEYTPHAFVSLQNELLAKYGYNMADYIVFDPCAGVGNLENQFGRDYKRYCYLSTLEQMDVDTCKIKGFENVVQFDFLKSQDTFPLFKYKGEAMDIRDIAKHENKKLMIIMNPPYQNKKGFKNNLAIEFFNKCLQLSPDAMVFYYMTESFLRDEVSNYVNSGYNIVSHVFSNASTTFQLSEWPISQVIFQKPLRHSEGAPATEESHKRDVSASPQHDGNCHSEQSEESHDKFKNVSFGDKQFCGITQGYIYIVSNKTNTTLYIGVTNDLKRRIYEHKNHVLKGFTDKYNCEKLVYFEAFSRIDDAIAREKYLKGKNREYKNQLINEINPDWVDLYDYLLGDVSALPQHDDATRHSEAIPRHSEAFPSRHSERSEESLSSVGHSKAHSAEESHYTQEMFRCAQHDDATRHSEGAPATEESHKRDVSASPQHDGNAQHDGNNADYFLHPTASRYEYNAKEDKLEFIKTYTYDNERPNLLDEIDKKIKENQTGSVLGNVSYLRNIINLTNKPSNNIRTQITTDNLRYCLLSYGINFNTHDKYFERSYMAYKGKTENIPDELFSDAICFTLFYKAVAFTNRGQKNYIMPFTAQQLGCAENDLNVLLPPLENPTLPPLENPTLFDEMFRYAQHDGTRHSEAIPSRHSERSEESRTRDVSASPQHDGSTQYDSRRQEFDFRVWLRQFSFSEEAKNLFAAALEVFRYYHATYAEHDWNDSFYDITNAIMGKDTSEFKTLDAKTDTRITRVKTTKGTRGFGRNTIKYAVPSSALPTFINFFDARDVLARKINRELLEAGLLLWERENIY